MQLWADELLNSKTDPNQIFFVQKVIKLKGLKITLFLWVFLPQKQPGRYVHMLQALLIHAHRSLQSDVRIGKCDPKDKANCNLNMTRLDPAQTHYLPDNVEFYPATLQFHTH